MLVQDYLSLRLVRLRGVEAWVRYGDGLIFVFAKAGSGQCLCQSNGGPHPVNPGDVLVLNSAARGELRVPDSHELLFWSFSVLIEHLFPLFGCREICLLQAITDGLRAMRLYPAQSALAVECHRLLSEVPPQFNLDHRGQLLRVAAAILSSEFRKLQPDGSTRMEEHITQVFENLSTAEILKLSVDELANRFGCSRRHLNRLFHQHLGASLGALRMEMRLLKAMSLLRDPNAKVINVAVQCGFNHLGLFNTCFKRRFGSSPGHWRKAVEPIPEQAPNPIGTDDHCRLRANGLCPWSLRSAGS